MSALATPPTTGDGLRERVEALAHELDAALKPYDEPSTRTCAMTRSRASGASARATSGSSACAARASPSCATRPGATMRSAWSCC